MKRYADLTPEQKKQVSPKFIVRAFKDVNDGFVPAPQEILDDQKELIKNFGGESFCGCRACIESILSRVMKTDRLKEFLMVRADKLAQDAWYATPGDDVVEIAGDPT